MHRSIFSSLAALFLVASSGCSIQMLPDDAFDGVFDQTRILLTAKARGDGTTEVTACVLRSVSLACDPDGAVIATSGGQEVTLAVGEPAPEEPPALRSQLGVLDGDEEGKVIDVSYKGIVDAPSNQLILPAPFTLTGPAPGETFAYDEEVVLTVDLMNGGNLSFMDVVASCAVEGGEPTTFFSGERITAASGELRLDGAALGLPAGQTCDVSVELVRELPGTVDPAFEIGASSAAGQQSRSVSFIVGPQ